MTCNDVRQHWMLYLDSEGDAELHFRISDHLGMCPACAEWFSQQQRLEQGLTERLAAGSETPELWQRVLTRAGVGRPVTRRRRWFVLGGVLAVAALLLAVVLLPRFGGSAHSELSTIAAGWHERLLDGSVQPEFVSISDEEVDRFLKNRVPFRVHCPPRSDVNFTVQGAGVCSLTEQQQAAYIVGRVEQVRVSILVLDRAGLGAFPQDGAQLGDGRRHRCQAGGFAMVAGIVADNVVVVIGSAPPEALEHLLEAYGSYHEG
jgi:anti-sigma factor RsiW